MSECNCVGCTFRREHPEEKRSHLIITAFDVIQVVIGAMADTVQARGRIMAQLRAKRIAPEDHEEQITHETNKLFDQALRAEFTSSDYTFTAVLEVFLALLPADVMAHARECYRAHIQAKAEELGMPEAVEENLATGWDFLHTFIGAGERYLLGVDHPVTHVGSSTVQ